jgi:hypothetical protein
VKASAKAEESAVFASDLLSPADMSD